MCLVGIWVLVPSEREVARMNLFRESINQDRRERVADERVQELKIEIQGLKREIEDLRWDNSVPCCFWVQSDRPNLAYNGNPRNRSRPSARSIRTS